MRTLTLDNLEVHSPTLELRVKRTHARVGSGKEQNELEEKLGNTTGIPFLQPQWAERRVHLL